MNILDLIVSQNNADNVSRNQAEMELDRLGSNSPTTVAYELIRACLSGENSIGVQQSCLLHLKRMVPKFWSMGFESFLGPPIEQETKSYIRESLISLATSSASSKIRSGSSYVIVQIAAADYPDEWPNLLEDIYRQATEGTSTISLVGSLSVLNELFDDLISEGQFWDGGVGSRLIDFIVYLLGQTQTDPEVKASALELYLTVMDTLTSLESLESRERRESVMAHMEAIKKILLPLLKQSISESSSSDQIDLMQLSLRSHLYQVFTKLLSNFRKCLSSHEVSDLICTLTEDLWLGSRIVKTFLIDEVSIDSTSDSAIRLQPDTLVTLYLSNLMETLTAAQAINSITQTLTPVQLQNFVYSLSLCAHYPKCTVDEYMSNFNVFVTDETGLSSHTTIRDSIKYYLGDLNHKDANAIFDLTKTQFAQNSGSWSELEALLFVCEGLFSDRESTILQQKSFLKDFIESLFDSIVSQNTGDVHPLLLGRIFLMVPKALEIFELSEKNASVCNKWFEKIFAICESAIKAHAKELILASALISATWWTNIEGFDLTILAPQSQASILKTCAKLLDDSEDDTLPILLEAIAVAIRINKQNVFRVELENNKFIVDLFLEISFEDPANVQVSINSSECLQILLAEIEMHDYLGVCEKSVPYLTNVMRQSLSHKIVSYSPQLELSIDLLGGLIEFSPGSAIPRDIFCYIFPVLKELIFAATDDQILQNTGELFNKLMQNNESLFVEYSDPVTGQSGLEILLDVVSKFLSLNLSDSAAMNCGLIVITLFENFQTSLNDDFFFQLLEATVRRIAIAKELVIVENLILVFCKLVSNVSPEMLVDSLTNMEVVDHSGSVKDGLATCLPIWFESFEVTRGIEKIQSNILALGKIFALGDRRVESLKVDGDLIPYEGDLIITRSKAKAMPQEFTQISASLKILKLLVSELRFQCSQPDPNEYVVHRSDEDDENDEEGWEDMNDLGVPDYEKLKSYVDSDEEDMEVSDKGIRDTIIQFFKECITKNIANFEQHYECLDIDEKSAISEYVLFT